MNLLLHANATTSPKTRALIQTSPLSLQELAEELGVSVSTVRRRRRRDFQHDASHTPHYLATTLARLRKPSPWSFDVRWSCR